MFKQWIAAGLLIVGFATLGGCASHTQVAGNSSPASLPINGAALSAHRYSAGQSDEEHRREIDELINEATVAPSIANRSAAVLAAADRSTSALADVLNAIEAARHVILSNVRGADTTGFKASRSHIDGHKAVFELDLTQGSLEQTTNPLGMAIQGNGYFAIKLTSPFGDGIAYTRAGNFYLNQKNELILGMGEGYRHVPTLTIPTGSTNILIGQDGTIQATPPGSATPRTLGQLQLAQFVNPQGMQTHEDSIYLATDESGPPITGTPGTNGLGLIQQGYLESSNVDLIRERLRLRFLNEWQNAIEQALAVTDAQVQSSHSSRETSAR